MFFNILPPNLCYILKKQKTVCENIFNKSGQPWQAAKQPACTRVCFYRNYQSPPAAAMFSNFSLIL